MEKSDYFDSPEEGKKGKESRYN